MPAAAPAADPHAIRSFLGMVGGNHLVAIRLDGPADGRHFRSDVDAATRWAVARNQQGWNIYWTVNRVREGFRGKPAKKDITAARYVHVDIDPPKDGSGFDPEAVQGRLGQLDHPPGLIVDSGGGLQAFWALDGEAQNLAAIEQINRALAKRLGGDHCHNVDRLMRVAGTVNWPDRRKIARGRQPTLARVIEQHPDRRYEASELAAVLSIMDQVDPAAPAPGHQAVVSRDIELVDADALGLGTLDPLRSLIEHPRGQDRSRDALACAGRMARDGYSDEQILGVLLNPANAVSAHVLDQRDPRYAARRCLEKVRQATSDAPRAPEPTERPPVRATPYAWRDPSTIPPRPWVLGRWLLRGTIAAAVAPGGVGKTTFLAAAALGMVTARPLLGKTTWNGPKRVWIWNLEDDFEELQRAIQAAALHYGITEDDLGEELFVDSAMEGAGLCTAVQDQGGIKLLAPVYDAITAELIARRIDVLIIDPFVSSHEVEENDNGAIDKVAKAWARVAKAASASIVLVHHTSKAGAAEVTALSGRGAVSLINACRSTLVFNRMPVDVAQRLGIEEEERRRYFAVMDDKHNRAPAEKADWFRLASVPLGNGGTGHGDEVAVAEPWSPPDPFENVTTSHLYRVQLLISQGDWKHHHTSEDWAGKAVASVLGLDVANKAHKARIQGLLKTWEANAALRVEERRDSRTRQQKKFVAVGRWANDASATPAGSVASHAIAVEHPGATLHPAPYRGAGVAAGAAVEWEVSQPQVSQPVAFPHGNPAFKPIRQRDPFDEAAWPDA